MSFEETALSVVERFTGANLAAKSRDDMAGTVIESNSDGNDYKAHSTFNSVVRPSSDKRKEIEHTFTRLCDVTEPEVETTIENSWPNDPTR